MDGHICSYSVKHYKEPKIPGDHTNKLVWSVLSALNLSIILTYEKYGWIHNYVVIQSNITKSQKVLETIQTS